MKQSSKPASQQPPARLNLSLAEALAFYGFKEDELYIKAYDENDKPVYAYRILPDRIVFVLAAGPKLVYPPQSQAHVAFVPQHNRKTALRLAGLAPADDEGDPI